MSTDTLSMGPRWWRVLFNGAFACVTLFGSLTALLFGGALSLIPAMRPVRGGTPCGRSRRTRGGAPRRHDPPPAPGTEDASTSKTRLSAIPRAQARRSTYGRHQEGTMGDKLRADTNLIRECSESLFRIHREFKNNSNPAEDYEKSLGHNDLQDVFDEFSETWEKTRTKLMEEIKVLADATKTAAEKYDEVDHKLAQALRDAKRSRGKK